jgi:large subunit ribosomal protein L3
VIKAIIGKKLGMTSIFNEQGQSVSVTVIEAGPVTVMQVKTLEHDKYAALQLGFLEKKLQRANKPETGHAKKAGVSPKKILREFRVEAEDLEKFSPGQEITLADAGFEMGDFVDVTGVSIGKGFAGVMKRHNFHGFKKTHGTHEVQRHGGSIGMAATPARVLKGKKMAGQMGAERVTVQNLVIAEVRPEQNLVLIKGAVPGHKNGIVMIRAAKKKRAKKDEQAA